MTEELLTPEKVIEWVKANALYVNPHNKHWLAKLGEWETQLAKAQKASNPELSPVEKMSPYRVYPSNPELREKIVKLAIETIMVSNVNGEIILRNLPELADHIIALMEKK